MRFYLDEDISHHVAAIARARGLDVISSHECGRNGLPDAEQLRLAVQDGRCFVTRNRDDFAALTTHFFEQGWPHRGVIIVGRSLPNHLHAVLAAALVSFASSQPDDLPDYTVVYLRPA